MKKPLIVYKASAGSGKTFTLATEYIKLLIGNPQDYRNILAVTFTNKATEEMKMRILSQLYGISENLPDSSMYMTKICRELDASPEFVSKQAGIALRLLMHNYNYFKVETIDSFFQTVLRNLARELDLTANLRIELNDAQIEEQAVDKLIEELDRRNEILGWILSYINDNISDDKNWNVIGQIKAFGKTIFKDFYKEHGSLVSEKMDRKGFFDRYTGKLRKEYDDSRQRMESFATAFFEALDSEGLTVGDLAYGKSGVGGFFVKLSNGIFDEGIVGARVAECLEDADKWATKKHPRREVIKSLADSRLIRILRQAVDERPKQWLRYKSAELTRRHLSQLRLLGSIESKVRELNAESNRFLLSDTQQLLHSLISVSDSPFVFEKIGATLRHVMIDEFQDTSVVQWQNFKVLLLECMSHEDAGNLIVGDVKQSIYRWRSGDWRLLNNITDEFPSPDKLLDIRTLSCNYRSRPNIIRFNNAFFGLATETEYRNFAEISEKYATQLRNAYSDVSQKFVGDDDGINGGLVEVTLLPHSDEYVEQTLQNTADIVARLINDGITANRIAILVRTNKHIPIIAKYFVDNMPEVKIVSDEAFRLDASLAVNILVNALHLLTHRADSLARATLIKDYMRVQNADGTNDDLLLADSSAGQLLPVAYTDHLDELSAMPLYELTERLYAIFGLQRLGGQSAYVCTFYDNMNAFIQDWSSDIDEFLNEWDTKIRTKTIQSDEVDGIRLISIHKSKGLEFDNVIIPFCDWMIEKSKGNILWCSPKQEPFSDLPLVPIDYSQKGLVGTIYENDYFDEYLQNCVDNLNLLYVAFTRAGQNLFVIGKRNASNSRSCLIQDCLPEMAQRLDGAVFADSEDKEQPITFCYGRISKSGVSDRKPTANIFLQPVENLPVTVETFEQQTEFKQSNKSRDFIMGDERDDSNREYVDMGCILHNVFSTIRTADDIDDALRRLELDGIVSAPKNIGSMLRKRLQNEAVADWFSGRWQLYNECTILSVDKETGEVKSRRPDRVMTDGRRMIVVDFKFGRPRDEYYAQIREYMHLLADMGYENIRGYLWFVYSNKIEEVTI